MTVGFGHSDCKPWAGVHSEAKFESKLETLLMPAARTATDLLSATSHGVELRRTLKNLGFWVQDGDIAPTRKPLQASPDNPKGLCNEMAYWESEFGRITDLLSALEAQVPLNKDALKRARHTALTTVRDEHAEREEKLPAKYIVEALVAAQAEVVELETEEANLSSLLILLKRQQDKIGSHVASISRQMSLTQTLVDRGV